MGQPLLDSRGVQTAQIAYRHAHLSVGADPLGAVRGERHPQHRMPRGERGGGGTKTLGVHPRLPRRGVELDVEVSGDAAQGYVLTASHPHGVLHRSQREGRSVRAVVIAGAAGRAGGGRYRCYG